MIPWSYSRLKVFETCPAQYEGKYVHKLPDPQREAALWGDRVHKDLEEAIRDNKPMPEATKAYEWATQLGHAAVMSGAIVHTEYKMGLTEELKPCSPKDREVWLRGIADLVVIGNTVAAVWDYKTGKRRNDNTQLKIMSAMVFEHTFATVERVESRFFWLQTKKQSGIEMNRNELPEVWEDLIARAKRIERAHQTGIFQPIPSWACKWCPVVLCRYNETRK